MYGNISSMYKGKKDKLLLDHQRLL